MWKARFACGVNSIGAGSILRLRLDQAQQVLPVGIVLHRLGDAHDVVRRDVAHAVRDLLDAGDHESLALLDRLDERRGLQERLVSPRVEPRDPAAELLDAELPAAEVRRVDVRDLELATCRGRETRRDLHDPVVVEVEARRRAAAETRPGPGAW